MTGWSGAQKVIKVVGRMHLPEAANRDRVGQSKLAKGLGSGWRGGGVAGHTVLEERREDDYRPSSSLSEFALKTAVCILYTAAYLSDILCTYT